jgi:hypothetical protein
MTEEEEEIEIGVARITGGRDLEEAKAFPYNFLETGIAGAREAAECE